MKTILPPFDLPVTGEDRILAACIKGHCTDNELTRAAQHIRQHVINETSTPRCVHQTPPELFRSVLLFSGDRYVVGLLRRDGKYYVEQDGLQFFPQYWYPLPSETA